MKTLFMIIVLLFCSAGARADGIDIFDVVEATGFGTIIGSTAPPTDYLLWEIQGPTNGMPADDFFVDLPLLYQLLGISLPSSGPEFQSIGRVGCPGPSVQSGCEWRETLQYPTNLPPGITVSSVVDVPTPTAAPEPTSFLFLGAAFVGIGAWRRLHHC